MYNKFLFILISGAATWFFAKKVKEISRNIKLGREENLDDNPGLRWKNVLLLALGQKKMFRNPLVAVLHFFVYAGFIIINIEVLEIVLDGIFGTHRLFAPLLGGFYIFLINAFEILAVLVTVPVLYFLFAETLLN
ncbi:MAG: hypothetical protein WDO16_25450 [Bacteroidota bacterium]